MPERASSLRSWWAAVIAVAATYVYFLIFAQFALLALAVQAGVAERLTALMAAMGAGGIGGAVFAARLFSPARSRSLLLAGFVLCALAAQVSLLVAGFGAWLAVFALVGVSLGAVTVTLAAMLRAAMRGGRLGLGVGLGTGAAYALCNLPAVFGAEPRVQTGLALAAAAVGAWSATRLAPQATADPPAPSRGVVARWVVGLTALVGIDSAVFAIIQQTPALKTAMWHGPATLSANAGVHLVAGVAAGMLLDAGWRRLPALVAIVLLATASLMLADAVPRFAAPQWLYVAGVSFYSVVLVYLPASTGRPRVAALVYAIAGWIGSALGIGMAQDLHRVPVAAVGVALAAVFVAFGGRGRPTLVTVLVALVALASGGRAEAADEIVARGREIYIREGCIHCHSQYVRPHFAPDVERWGPATTLEQTLAGTPPLPGNRRQGPDLANVGNRRSGEWNRLHLQAPRAVAPGSRMPSYAHLFARRGDESDGEALVAYLASLGAETIPGRLAQVRGWRSPRGRAIEPERAREMFSRLCANCHGDAGRGDGALAGRLSVRPPDWSEGAWRQVRTDGEVELELARIVKFGLPGSPMAGHEYLRDEEILGLARLVQAWQKR